MAATNFPALVGDENKDRVRATTFAMIAVNAGVLKATSTYYLFNGVACSLEDFPDITMEPIDERETVLVGKPIIKSNSGYKVGSVAVVLQGNDIAIPASIKSQNLAVEPVLRIGDKVSDFGHVLILSYAADPSVLSACTLICRASCDIMQAPGASPGGNKFNINIYSDYGQVYQSKAGIIFNLETWFADGVNVTNANAPNGALDTFVLGTSNNATSAYVASSALVMDNTVNLGSHAKYIPCLMVYNATTTAWSVLRDTTDFTFTLATGTITMVAGSAYENLPAGSKIVAVWASTKANATTLASPVTWQAFQGV